MPSYVLLAKFTKQGIETVKDVPKRRATARQTAESMGVKWVSSFLVMGRYDVVIILEAPDDETVARFVLATGVRGNLSTETLRAFPDAEMDAILAKI